MSPCTWHVCDRLGCIEEVARSDVPLWAASVALVPSRSLSLLPDAFNTSTLALGELDSLD